ncbi:polyadenylate-binding protein [Plakobranchus ocellatus]|uniref:Polyadenylate-binding protein n=1 Tax=Plakobranchus ocellatus TaxID=259542 RepID=A0AAV3Y929_9GAST|nr:polyadenylate-binding protein [Plakobranchus ocellatus]
MRNRSYEHSLQERVSLSYDDIGAILYGKVSLLEPDLASKITGMLLELDTTTLLDLVDDLGSALPAAVEKAKAALDFLAQHQSDFPVASLANHDSGEMANNLRPDGSWMSDNPLREQFGPLIFKEVVKDYPNCAANITGMLLELNISSLTMLINDKTMLNEAAHKCYQTYLNSFHSSS